MAENNDDKVIEKQKEANQPEPWHQRNFHVFFLGGMLLLIVLLFLLGKSY